MKTKNYLSVKMLIPLFAFFMAMACLVPIHGSAATCKHDYKQINVLKHYKPNCTDHGCYLIEWKCTLCGDNYTVESNNPAEPPLGHNFVNDVCTRCGEEHSYTKAGTFVAHYDATCDEGAYDEYKAACEFCGKEPGFTLKVYDSNSPELGHNFVNDVCTRCGQQHCFTVASSQKIMHYGASITNKGYTLYKAACKNCGTVSDVYTISVEDSGNSSLAAPAIKKAKNKSGKKISVTWKKVANITGYQIQYSKNQNFSKAKTKKVSKSKTSYTISKLTKKKTYYVRIRSYKKTGGKVTYSSWSAAKAVKIKK